MADGKAEEMASRGGSVRMGQRMDEQAARWCVVCGVLGAGMG
jgi:hypothetical protein